MYTMNEVTVFAQVARGRFVDLFSSEYRRTTISMWVIWFGTAFVYYGMILAQSEILEFHKTCASGTGTFRLNRRIARLYCLFCTFEIFLAPSGIEDTPLKETCHCNLLSLDDYKQMIIATFGEFFIIPLNMLLVDGVGRRLTLAVDFIMAGVFFLLIQLCVPRLVETLFIFGVRGFSSGLFNIVYIYTLEVSIGVICTHDVQSIKC